MIERTQDYRRIKRLSDWDLIVSDRIFYLVVVENNKDLGVLCFLPYNDGLITHASLGPECRGSKAANAYRDSFEWIFNNTNHEIICAEIPYDLRHVCFLARHVGMDFKGVDGPLRLYNIEKNVFKEAA